MDADHVGAVAQERLDLGRELLGEVFKLRPEPGLQALAGVDEATDLRAVFGWSYDSLSAEAARLFRFLSLHPGPDISVASAASLAGASPTRVPVWLTELTRAHLITEHRPGRYVLHDLLRAYAVELVHRHDPELARRDGRAVYCGQLIEACGDVEHESGNRRWRHPCQQQLARRRPESAPDDVAVLLHRRDIELLVG